MLAPLLLGDLVKVDDVAEHVETAVDHLLVEVLQHQGDVDGQELSSSRLEYIQDCRHSIWTEFTILFQN